MCEDISVGLVVSARRIEQFFSNVTVTAIATNPKE